MGSHSGDSSFPQGHAPPGQTKTWLISGASFIPKAHHRLPCREAIFEGSGTYSTEQKCEDSALSHSPGSCSWPSIAAGPFCLPRLPEPAWAAEEEGVTEPPSEISSGLHLG